jgi:GNAT superfamily N-acetyltransferase
MHDDAAESPTTWPADLSPGALRWARASSHYEETITFYRDVLGLPVLGEFGDSFGEDGTIFGLPDTRTQMEIVRAQGGRTAVGSFDQLVLYLDDADAVTTATARLRRRGLTPDPAPHPYWAANGAVTYVDPDGRDVVFAPWVYGRDPEPVDQVDQDTPGQHPPRNDRHPAIGLYTGDRAELRWLFEEAEDSGDELDGHLDRGRVLVARYGSGVVGHLQLVPTARDGEVELKNMAVAARLRGTGIGRSLVAAALGLSADEGMTRMLVATAAADIGNLRFYQRCGFRFASVERDAFTPQTGYPESIDVDGIPLRDRVWLSRDL